MATSKAAPASGSALLKTALQLRGLTQMAAARLTGITQPCFSRYLSGKSTPVAGHRIILNNAFGIPFPAWGNGGRRWPKSDDPEKPDSSAASGTPST